MKKNTNKYADLMLDRISQCIEEETKNLPAINGAVVSSVNTDGTINVCFPPDYDKIFTNLSNQTPFLLEPGDSVELLLKDGSYNNCWIIAKHQTTFDESIMANNVNNNYATMDDLKKIQASLLTEIDPVFINSPAYEITSQDITNWNNMSVVQPAITNPVMDGVANIGSENTYARADHVHPSDTSRQATITADGILKGNGSGSVTAAVAGADYQAPLPSQSGNSGKFLTTDGSTLSWGEAGEASFIAAYDSTTFAQVLSAYTAGKQIFVTDANTCNIYVPLVQYWDGEQNVQDSVFKFVALCDGIVNSGLYLRYVSITLDYDDNWTKIYDILPYATLANPHFTGIPTAPTPSSSSINTQIATKGYVDSYSLPSQSGQDGKYLSTNGTNASWSNISFPVTSVNSKTGAITLTASDVGALSDSTVIPVATTTTPTMDGIATIGSETTWAKGDHVHPTDTSRAPIISPAFTGIPTAPTASAGTDSTQIATTAFVQAAVQIAGGVTPASALPIEDGVAAVGTSLKYAREDHVHPLPSSIPKITLVDWTV